MIGAITAGLFAGGVAASTNSYESIATVTVGSGGSSSISFSSIPSTFKHLQLRCLARSDYAGTIVSLHPRPNGETGTNFSDHYIQGNGSTVVAGGAANQNFPTLGLSTAANYGSSIFAVSVIDFLEYGNTNIYKTMRGLAGGDANGAGTVGLYSASWRNTAAISSLSIIAGAGNFVQYSSFALYGIRG